MRAPLIILVACRAVPGTKVPVIEQILAAGAAAQNILLGLHNFGYAAAWKTGEAAYDPEVKKSLGLAVDDHIVGIHLCRRRTRRAVHAGQARERCGRDAGVSGLTNCRPAPAVGIESLSAAAEPVTTRKVHQVQCDEVHHQGQDVREQVMRVH